MLSHTGDRHRTSRGDQGHKSALETEASMRCSYIYFRKDNPDRVAAVAPEHAAYWRGLELRDYLGGPVADRSGGLISFGDRFARRRGAARGR